MMLAVDNPRMFDEGVLVVLVDPMVKSLWAFAAHGAHTIGRVSVPSSSFLSPNARTHAGDKGASFVLVPCSF